MGGGKFHITRSSEAPRIPTFILDKVDKILLMLEKKSDFLGFGVPVLNARGLILNRKRLYTKTSFQYRLIRGLGRDEGNCANNGSCGHPGVTRSFGTGRRRAGNQRLPGDDSTWYTSSGCADATERYMSRHIAGKRHRSKHVRVWMLTSKSCSEAVKSRLCEIDYGTN